MILRKRALAIVIVACVFLLLFASIATAQDRGFGIGVILGEPTGISMKRWLDYTAAFDVAVAWSFEGRDFLTVHADYLSHHFRIIKVEEGLMPFYYGIGGKIKFNENADTRLAVRVPFGLAYLFERITLDIFVEIVPLLDLYPGTDFRLNAALGVRYFFD